MAGDIADHPACLVMWKGPSLLRWMGQEKQTVLLAKEYLEAIMWGVPPLLWFAVLRHFLQGLSRPRVVMMITIGGVVLNAGANYVFMHGRLGFRALGVAGCGWASTLVFWSMFLVMVCFIWIKEEFRVYRLFDRFSKPDSHNFSEIFRIGWPIGVMQGLEVSLFSATTFLMGLFGVTVLAAHQIALQCASYTFMIPLGLSLAVSVRVGQATGRKDLAGAHRAGYVGVGFGAGFMMISATCFWLLPGSIISLFLDIDSAANTEVVAQTIALLGIAAAFQVCDGVQVTAAGALRGLKDTRAPMVVALIAYWFVGLSSGYLLGFQLNWGGGGLWWGLVLGLTTAAIFLPWRFHRQINRPISKPEFPR